MAEEKKTNPVLIINGDEYFMHSREGEVICWVTSPEDAACFTDVREARKALKGIEWMVLDLHEVQVVTDYDTESQEFHAPGA